MITIRKPFVLFGLLLSLLSVGSSAPARTADDKAKMTPDTLIAKHLEAIGATETRSSISSRIVAGKVAIEVRGNTTGQSTGDFNFAAEGRKSLLVMQFENSQYPYERASYDGERFNVGDLRPGVRSTLGNFLLTYDTVFKQGLFGGVLSTAWPLLDLSAQNPKLELAGKKKINGREAYVLKYLPRKGSDLEIRLFFDAETFRHVRTSYERTISAQMGSNPNASASQRETRYEMVEDFSDFQKEGGLTLPHGYKLTLMIQGNGGTAINTWTSQLTRFVVNQKIPAEAFNVKPLAARQ